MNRIDLQGRVAVVTGGARGLGAATARRFIDSGARVAAEALEREAGSLDILVNNAGITGGNGKTWELDPDVWRKVIEVNLVAPYLTSRAVVPGMVRRGYGRIVNIASIAGKEGNPNACLLYTSDAADE